MQFALEKQIHPATLTLLRSQSKAKFARMVKSFLSPRRRWLAILATVLGVVWLSQLIIGAIFRPAADPQNLMVWIPLTMLIYSSWHLVKTVAKKDLVPFDWTPAENELLRTAPVTQKQLINYRLTTIACAGLIKASCFCLVMIQDLNFLLAGFVGMFLGLVFVDLLRISGELFYDALTKVHQRIAKAIVFSTGIATVGIVFAQAYLSFPTVLPDNTTEPIVFLHELIKAVIGLTSTPAGETLLAPFKIFASVALTQTLGVSLFGQLVLATALVFVSGHIVFGLDKWRQNQIVKKEKSTFEKAVLISSQQTDVRTGLATKLRTPIRMAGYGPLVWRQLLSVLNYKSTLIVSLGIPIVLCCLPLLQTAPQFRMLAIIVALLIFYSFLLLPAALMLDYRRDINRMFVFKSFPARSLTITLAQLTTPVLLCTIFQASVLLIATITGKVVGWHAMIAIVLIIPINVLIFASENLIFLLSPYQRNKEGVDVFLRTILTFTAKGIAFFAALIAVGFWATTCGWIGTKLGLGVATKSVVFGSGIWIATAALAIICIIFVDRLFQNLDPSQDIPAES